MICYYTDDDDCDEIVDITLDFVGSADRYEVYLLDSDHDAECVGEVNAGGLLQLAPNTVCLLKSISE